MLDGHAVVEGEVIVRYRSDAGTYERQRAEFQVESDATESVGRRGARRMHSRRLSTRAMLQALRANPDVEYAEPNYVIDVAAVPNDPSFGSLWGLFNAGSPNADIHATTAWDVTTGSRANVVAIIDTGIDYNHRDLRANVWSAPRAFSVVVGGVTITCGAGTHGYDAISNTCDPMDDNSHGTHVAGTIGAVGNNGQGVAGVNWLASMMALKFLDSGGHGYTSDAIKAIEFAIQAKAALGADANIRVLNNSWGGGGYSQALYNEIDAANSSEMLFVAAAGNAGTNNDASAFYPASYLNANVVSVAATTSSDQRASFSNYGAASVDLGAPGNQIVSTVPNDGYASYSGTSMATPHVSGAAALVLSRCAATTATLKSALLTSVDPIPAMTATVSGGRLNVDAALHRCLYGQPSLTASVSGTTITAQVTNGPANAKDWLALYCPAASADNSYLSWKYLNGSTIAASSGVTSATVAFNAPATASMTCNVRLFANNVLFRLATSANVTTTVVAPTVAATAAVFTGEPINVVVSNGPAAAADWVALFDSATPGSTYVDWKYLNGLRTVPASGISNATVQLTAPAVPGTYHVRLLSNNSATSLATSGSIVVSPRSTSSAAPAITLQTTSTAPGGTIAFTVSGGPANPLDWIALAAAGSADNTYLDWQYLDGSKTKPSSGQSSASLHFTAPLAPGNYVLRLFANNVLTRLAVSDPIVVANGPTLSINDVSVAEGNSGTAMLTFTVSLAPVNNAAAVSVAYATSNGTASAGSDYVASSGTLTFNPSVATQTISIAVNGDSAIEGNETLFLTLSSPANALLGDAQGVGTILNDDIPPGPSVVVSTSTVPAHGTISFSVTGGPANRLDWVALVPAGAPDNQYVDWVYLNGSKTGPATGLGSASLQFTAPAAGTFDVRFFANNQLNKLATSTPVVVTP